jgi:hypothetical protein
VPLTLAGMAAWRDAKTADERQLTAAVRVADIISRAGTSGRLTWETNQ